MNDKLAIIIPFNRIYLLDSVVNTWKDTGCQILLCVNPEFKKYVPQSSHYKIVVGQASIGGARNAGIIYAHAIGAEWSIFADDDNYYNGIKYINQIKSYINNNVNILSQGIRFVRFSDGNLHLFKSKLSFAPGHCSAVRTEIALPFPEINLGEDVLWTQKMEQAGYKLFELPPWQSIYNRNDSLHAYEASKIKFMKNFGQSHLIGKVDDSFVNESKIIDHKLVTASNEEYLNDMLERSKKKLLEMNAAF